MALAKVFDLGKKAEQHQQTERALKIAKIRLEVENEINRKSNADVRATFCSVSVGAQQMNGLLVWGGYPFIWSARI
ncbi:hypothetical protein X471_00276 [Bartonella bacilliformis str. Heidi Mejia]|nr:hypothetical protein X471_00276 [Bartonella bacilliformis str. Heidi Mejia]KEG18272.1 hypothetical protein H707_00929 [Bartonella bacilliformis Hosp800-02]KEG18933.1 hypothetical protein H707_00671 [Bartonella bacilliformis Hosp800-02]KEG23445.1 hypothetical protein H708_00679 [Bartonella bacilliformis VAB9028]KEG24390.1 hypothetical protein H706_00681 [Bartonella bacilliformis CAR600-02]